MKFCRDASEISKAFKINLVFLLQTNTNKTFLFEQAIHGKKNFATVAAFKIFCFVLGFSVTIEVHNVIQ